ncbi:MAG: hypothetical protein HYZ01_01665, partial [Ignavibacteriales bacterium]|nr:hypothetical protein [Ignavibacteriales bacterium]
MKSGIRFFGIVLTIFIIQILPAQSKPDLIVQTVWTEPAQPVKGQSYLIKATVKNQGNATASAPLFANLECYFYVNNVQVGEGNFNNLAAGSSITLSTGSLTAPTASSITVKAFADANSESSESNETNNQLSSTITLVDPPKPDLVVQTVWTEPAQPVKGQSYLIKATVKNQGNATASAPSFANLECYFYVNDAKVGEGNFNNLAAGSSITLSTGSLTAPTTNSITVKAFADANSESSESNETNNQLSGTITLVDPPKPDLIIQDIDISSASPIAGESVTITATVKNQGSANAGSFYLGYYVDNGFIGEDLLSFGLNAGNSNNETISYTAEVSGTHTIKVIADYKSQISESDENNNTRSETFTWNSPPKPDLVVQAVWTEPAQPVKGQSYLIKATVKNQGNATASAPSFANLECYFYVNDAKVGEGNFNNLAAGGLITLSTGSLTAPTTNSITVKAFADANSESSESNETNNQLSSTLTLVDPPKTGTQLSVTNISGKWGKQVVLRGQLEEAAPNWQLIYPDI